MFSSKELSIIIPAAGMGYRMRSYGPKILLKVGNESILDRQVRILRKKFPFARILIVGGFQYEKILASASINTEIIINEDFENNNVVASLDLALQQIKTNKVLIVYGDLIFDDNIFDVELRDSALWVDSFRKMKGREIGLSLDKRKVIHMSYGLPLKWCHILFLMDKELLDFVQEVKLAKNRKKFTFEILNKIIDNGACLKAISSPGQVFEVDLIKDLEIANVNLGNN